MNRSCRPALAALVLLALALTGTVLAATKPSDKKTQSRPARPPSSATRTQTSPAAAPTLQSNPAIVVKENYYLDLPGLDLSTLTPKQKDRFLERVNKELCTCGCPNDTIARCWVNDPKCSTVRGQAEKVLSEVKAER